MAIERKDRPLGAPAPRTTNPNTNPTQPPNTSRPTSTAAPTSRFTSVNTAQHKFGEASPLRTSLPSRSSTGSSAGGEKPHAMFRQPKPVAQRPEFHLAGTDGRPRPQQPVTHKPVGWGNGGAAAYANAGGSQWGNGGAAAYGRPGQGQTRGHVIQQPVFSSMGGAGFHPINVGQSASKEVIDLTNTPKQNVVDLTERDSDDEFDPDAGLREAKFGETDPYAYMDGDATNKNLKALLEGAFNEEGEGEGGEQPKRRLPRRAKQVVDKAKAVGKTLADKLSLLDVKDKEEKDGKPAEEPDEDDGTVDGLKVKLLPHQIDGVAWMLEKESSEKKRGVLPYGGILADDMGLGKTIQALSLILTNPRPSKEELEKEKRSNRGKRLLAATNATLVVAPLALIRQWEAEIKSKTDSMTVHVHHGPSRTKSAVKLQSYDVVVTTYQTLMSEHANSDYANNVMVGCMGVKWYRVILDEAHTIKNPRAKSTQAAYNLNSVYRWCLTGTPMQNNLEELQSLIRFLRIKPYSDTTAWKTQIMTPMKNGRGGIAMKRLQLFLSAFMKRRTKDVLKKDGALGGAGTAGKDGKGSTAGFKIVGRDVKVMAVEFSLSERKFYDRLMDRAQNSLEQMMSSSKTDYIGALVLLLRLRQACDHPQLMMAKMEKDKDALATAQATGSKGRADDKDVDDIADLLGGLSVQTKKCDICKTSLTREETADNQIRCGDCEIDIEEQAMAGKVSLFKRGKVKSKPKKEKKGKIASSADEKARLRAARRQQHVINSDDEDEAEWIVSGNKRKGERDGKVGTDDEDEEGGGDWIGNEDSHTEGEDDSSEDEEEDDDDADSSTVSSAASGSISFDTSSNQWKPSTKILHLLEILAAETPEHKVIVFSQFTSMLDIIEPFLRQTGHRFCRYDGSMRNDAREESLNKLRTDQKTRVLLCSLKCGSLGLNLTAASRVVIMEPFWNPFVEEQAIDRVHRLNQTRDVVVYRLTIASTVEEKILALQDSKRKLAAAALEGGAAIGKLSMADILALFKSDADHKAHPEDEELAAYHGNGPKVLGQDRAGGEGRAGGMATPARRAEHPVWGRR